MKLTLARSQHAEQVAEFYRALHDGDFPHREMFSGETVARLLRDEELAVVVASTQRRIIGCGMSFPQTWNQSLEIGTLSVDDVPRRGEIGKALFEALRRMGLKRYGLVYFRASTRRTFERGRRIGATTWGFRPASGSSDLRRAELLMGFFAPESKLPRVHPPDNLVTARPFAARIVEGLPDADRHLPYPKTYPVGHPRGTGVPVISGRVWPTYHSKGNFVTIENTAGRYPTDIIREFCEKARKKGVRDIRLAMPVNQEQAFVDLVDLGFTPVAYLPGWYLRKSHRFDCVELSKRVSRPARLGDSFIERAAAKVIDDLALPN